MKQLLYQHNTKWKGRGPFGIIANWMNTVGKQINGIEMLDGGSVQVRHDGIWFRMGGAGGQFSGTAYVVGVPTTGLNSDGTKPYVKCNLATGVATEDAGPMPNPFDHDEEWFEKANTYGDIHAIR